MRVLVLEDRPGAADEVVGDLEAAGLSVVRCHEPGSTDANVPIALGIPAICIGVTTGGFAHREDEFINISPIPTGMAQLVTTILQSAEALA